MIAQALVINQKLEGRKNNLVKLSLFVRSGPCFKIPRRSIEKKRLSRHLFLVRFWSQLFAVLPQPFPTGCVELFLSISCIGDSVFFLVFRLPRHHGAWTRNNWTIFGENWTYRRQHGGKCNVPLCFKLACHAFTWHALSCPILYLNFGSGLLQSKYGWFANVATLQNIGAIFMCICWTLTFW